jgi:hypothetical protein
MCYGSSYVINPGEIFVGELILTKTCEVTVPFDRLAFKLVLESVADKQEIPVSIDLNSGELVDWKIIGPFAKPVDELEQNSDLVEYKVNNVLYQWQDTRFLSRNAQSYVELMCLKHPDGIDPKVAAEMNTNKLAYAKLDLLSDKEQTVKIRFYADRKISIRLNNKQVYNNEGIVLEDELSLNLDKGVNKLVVRVGFNYANPCSNREFGFCMKLAGPVDGLLIK